jgi:hypothetical protein
MWSTHFIPLPLCTTAAMHLKSNADLERDNKTNKIGSISYMESHDRGAKLLAYSQ